MTPAIAVPWPPRYLVAECTTTSAPHSSGRIRYGVATVLSTTSGTPISCATAATPSMSSTSCLGLEIVSAKNALVLSRAAARQESRSSGSSTNVVVMPSFGKRVVQQVVGAAVQARARHDVVARLGQVQQRDRLGRLAGRQQQRADAALEVGDPLLDRRPWSGSSAGCRCCRTRPGRTGSRRDGCRRRRTRWSGRSAARGRSWWGRRSGRRGSDGSRRTIRCSCARASCGFGCGGAVLGPGSRVRPAGTEGAARGRCSTGCRDVAAWPGWPAGRWARTRTGPAGDLSGDSDGAWRGASSSWGPPAGPALARRRRRRAGSSPGAPHRGGGLPASEPGLRAGAHDLRPG